MPEITIYAKANQTDPEMIDMFQIVRDRQVLYMTPFHDLLQYEDGTVYDKGSYLDRLQNKGETIKFKLVEVKQGEENN